MFPFIVSKQSLFLRNNLYNQTVYRDAGDRTPWDMNYISTLRRLRATRPIATPVEDTNIEINKDYINC